MRTLFGHASMLLWPRSCFRTPPSGGLYTAESDTRRVPMKVVVTGAGGCLGEVVVSRLLERPDIESVVGLDRAGIDLEHPKFVGERFDMREPCLPAVFRRADAL